MPHAQAQPPKLVPVMAVVYALHRALYGIHSNPRKCPTYNVTACPSCGAPHPCPAGN